MEKNLVNRIEMTVDNYRIAKEYLRNDGDILNHFASLVFTHYEKEIPVERVKEIRKYIKSTTTRMSAFRGDTLYMLSLLIATIDQENQINLIEDIYESMKLLEEQGFDVGSYLVLTAYVISRYNKLRSKREIVTKI